MLLLYLLICIIGSGANYFIVSQSDKYRVCDDEWFMLESIIIGLLWPIAIGITVAKYVKVYREKKRSGRE